MTEGRTDEKRTKGRKDGKRHERRKDEKKEGRVDGRKVERKDGKGWKRLPPEEPAASFEFFF